MMSMSSTNSADSTWRNYWRRRGLLGTLIATGLVSVLALVYREWTLLIAVAVTTPFLLAFSALLSIFRYRWVLPFWRRKYRSVHDTDSASQSPSGEPPLLRLRYVALVSFIMVFLAASVIPIVVLSVNAVVGVALGLGLGTTNVVVTYFVGRSNRNSLGAPVW
jgi:hypothetical protein